MLKGCHKDAVQAYFDNTWTLNESLFAALQGEEAFYRPPYHHLRHPMIFYYGHTVSFYINKLVIAGVLKEGINPYFEEIFEVGVDEMRWDDMSKNTMQWPTVSQIHEYRQQVYQTVSKVISEQLSEPTDVDMNHPLWSLFMAFEHDRIHLETSSVLIRELPKRLVRPAETFPEPYSEPVANPQDAGTLPHFPTNELVANAGGKVTLGKTLDMPSFGWDNEYGSRQVSVPSFQASKFLVSNGEFLTFVKSGGYRDELHWSQEGAAWKKFRNAKWPFFWEQDGPQGSFRFKLRTLTQEVAMPWRSPALVNYHEAKAFCAWKSEQMGFNNNNNKQSALRLVTEAEHQLLRNPEHRSDVATPSNDPAFNFGGLDMPGKAGVNLNLAFGSEIPVDALPPTKAGYHDVMGNAWEWAEDHFNPLPKFKVHSLYDDFSTPCFDGEHHMILGGSFMSTGDAGANLHCRYHFRPHFLQHSSFRYVLPSVAEAVPGQGVATHLDGSYVSENHSGETSSPDAGNVVVENTYETQGLVDQYLALHFGQSPQSVDSTVRPHTGRPIEALEFPQRCGQMVDRFAKSLGGAKQGPEARALDIGCAVGGTSFELSKNYGKVIGVDFSSAFIKTANQMKTEGEATYTVPTQGKVFGTSIKATLDPTTTPDNVEFMVGDACDLPTAKDFGGKFDAIVMANLLCRLPEPEKCLRQLSDLMNPGGVLVIVSPYSWLDEFTNEEKWLGGTTEHPDASRVVRELVLSQGFEEVHEEDMPLLIREHERKYQYIVSHGTVYQKK